MYKLWCESGSTTGVDLFSVISTLERFSLWVKGLKCKSARGSIKRPVEIKIQRKTGNRSMQGWSGFAWNPSSVSSTQNILDRIFGP